MTIFRNTQSNRRTTSTSRTRKASSIRQTPYLAPESLEQRRLMAADAFEFRVLDDPNAQVITHQIDQPVQELATARVNANLDIAVTANLGLGDRPEAAPDHTLNDLAIMDLMGGSDQTPQPPAHILNDLNPPHGSGDHGAHTLDRLPPQFEQLHMELGDQGFAEWLQHNQVETGTLSGIPADAIGDLDPIAIQQFDQAEAALHHWLVNYHESTSEPETPEPGSDGPVVFEVAGDTDGDGEVTFSDFLTLSSNFSTTVESGYLAGDFDLDGIVAFSDFLVLSSNFGTTTTTVNCGCDVSDANNPVGATKIQGAGELEIRDGSIVFVSDKTVPGDADDLKEDAPDGTPIHTGMKSWQDVVNKLKDVKDGSITGDLVLSGHGADGGVDGSTSDLDGQELTKEQAEIIKKKLGKGARIVVLGCCQANKQEDEHMQRMADMTGVPVVGNQGSVNDGANGKDDWFRFDPKPKKK